MDPYVVAIWIVRIAFLGGLYLFMFGVTRLLLRDLRAAARDPGGALARLVVVGSDVSEPPRGTVFGLDAVATIGRDVNNSIVVEDEFASAEHATLTFRGRAWYVEDLGSTNGTFVNGPAHRGPERDHLRRRAPGGPGSVPLRAGPPMTAAARPHSRPAIRRIQVRARRRESGLLVLVALVLVLGSVSLGATQRELAGQKVVWLPADAGQLAIYLGALVAAHLTLVLAGRRSDQVLLPTIGLLGGISLLLMERLPQSLVTQSLAGRTFGLASIQLGWLLLALAVITATAILVRSDAWLRRYKYTWAAAGSACCCSPSCSATR